MTTNDINTFLIIAERARQSGLIQFDEMPAAAGAGARIGINKSAGTTSRVARAYSMAACFIFP